MTLADMEKLIILKAYRVFGKNKTMTAAALGISLKTLYNKFNEYGSKLVGEDVSTYDNMDEAPTLPVPNGQKLDNPNTAVPESDPNESEPPLDELTNQVEKTEVTQQVTQQAATPRHGSQNGNPNKNKRNQG